jgi:hypothetical protein
MNDSYIDLHCHPYLKHFGKVLNTNPQNKTILIRVKSPLFQALGLEKIYGHNIILLRVKMSRMHMDFERFDLF